MMQKFRSIQRSLYICTLCLALMNAAVYPRNVEFPLIQSISCFPYSENSLLEKGTFSVIMDWYWSNDYMLNDDHSIMNDFEMLSGTIGLRYGITAGGTLELYYRHSFIFGGILDKFIEDFHRTFGFPDDNRLLYPRNSVHYRFGDSFFYTGSQNAASHLTAAFLKGIYRSDRFSLNARAAVGIPLSGKPGFSSGKPFFSAGMVVLYKKRWFSLEFSNYLSVLGKPSWLSDVDIRSFIFFSQLEARAGRWIGGLTFRTSPFEKGDEAHNAYQVYLGFKITDLVELVILEDFDPFDTTPDISFNLRIKFKKKIKK